MVVKKLKWSLVDNMLVSGSNFLLLLLGAQFLPVAEQGKLGLYFSLYIGIVVINLTLIHQNSAVKAPRSLEPDTYRNELFSLQLILAVATSVFSFCIYSLFVNERIIISNILLIILVFYAQQVADFNRRSAYVFESDKKAFLSSLLVYPPRIIFLLIYKPESFHELLYVVAISLIPILFISLRRYIKEVANKMSLLSSIPKHMSESKWLVMTVPFMWGWANIPVFLLSEYSGLIAVGIYATIRSFTSFSSVFLELLETKGSSYFGKKANGNKNYLYMHREEIFKAVAFGWSSVLVFIWLFAELFMTKFYGEFYASFSKEVTMFWLAQGFIFLFRIYIVHLRTVELYAQVFYSYLVGTVTVCTICFIFINLGFYNQFWAILALIFGALAIYLAALLFSVRFKS